MVLSRSLMLPIIHVLVVISEKIGHGRYVTVQGMPRFKVLRRSGASELRNAGARSESRDAGARSAPVVDLAAAVRQVGSARSDRPPRSDAVTAARIRPRFEQGISRHAGSVSCAGSRIGTRQQRSLGGSRFSTGGICRAAGALAHAALAQRDAMGKDGAGRLLTSPQSARPRGR